jgi:hypothetical protein
MNMVRIAKKSRTFVAGFKKTSEIFALFAGKIILKSGRTE